MSNNLRDAYISAKEGNINKLMQLLNSEVDVNYKYDLDWTFLHLAAQYGHVALVNVLLKNGADIDSKSKLGYTPLHDAAFLGHRAVVTELLKFAANINLTTNEGFTALHLVAWNRNVEITSKRLQQNVDINSRTNNACTTHYLDSENVNLNITKELLEHGADVNCENIYDNTPLHYASISGHVTMVTELLNNGADVNFKNKYDNTPLHYASLSGHLSTVSELLKHNAVVNFNYKDDYTPLHYASINGHVNVITELVKHGADVNSKIKNNNTPLHCASRRGHVNVITELLKLGANVNLSNIHGNTPLYCASKRGHLNVVIELLKHGLATVVNLKNINFNTPLHRASDEGHVNIISELLKQGADVNLKNKYPGTPLHCASDRGHINVINELLKHGADVNSKNVYDNTPLHCASKRGHVNVVTKLLEHGADVNFGNKYDNTPLHCASEQGHINVLQELIKHKSDVNYKNKYNNTPLHCASEEGLINVVTELLKHKVDVNLKNEYDNTPLHCASRKGNVAIINLLIKHGAIVNLQNEGDDTPLHCASIRGHVNVVTELLKCGADVNLKNKYPGSPMHCASDKGHVSVVTELISHGDVNVKNKNGDTPLHCASLNGHLNVITELIKHGADVNVKNKKDETPLHIASLKGHVHIFNELQKYGAVQNFNINPFKTNMSLDYEIIYDKEHQEIVRDLQEKILKNYIFTTLSEPEISQDNLQEILSFFDVLFPNAGLISESLHSTFELCDLEILYKLFEYNFYGEFISAFQYILKTDNHSPLEINLPGIGKIPYEELLKIANQSYHDITNNFIKNFWPHFKNLFKSACNCKSDDVQNKMCKILGTKFTKNIHSEVERFVKDYKASPFLLLQKPSDCEIFSDLQNKIQSFEIQKVLTKIGGFIAGIYTLSKNPHSFHFLKPKSSLNIILQDNSHDLQEKFFKLLVQTFIKPFKYPYVKVVKTYENSFCPDVMKIQGSGGDGFLIYGKEKSDLDFIYALKIFNSSLKFTKLEEDPEAPAHVIIQVVPSISECRNEQEIAHLMTNLELHNGKYYLNIKQIKKLIEEHIKNQLVNCPPDYLVLLQSENDTCFRIQFTYNVITVMINHLHSHILQLTDFIDSFPEVKVALEKLLNNISGNYYVSQLKWDYFQTILKLCSESKHHQVVPSSTKTNDLEFIDFHIDLEIERIIKSVIQQINSSIQSLEYFDKKFIFLVNILEDLFYLLIFILISWGLHTVIPVFRNKSFFCSPLPSFDDKIKFIFSEKVFFKGEDIEQILNIDLASICTKEITPKQKTIEIYICASLIILRRDALELFCSYKDNVKSKPSNFQDFNISWNEKLRKGISTNNMSWHLSMIIHVTELLEILKSCMQFNNNKNMNNPIVVRDQEQTFEVVPCLKFEGWPEIALAWVTRERYWPDSAVIDKIINNYCYVVFKSSRNNSRYDGRLSFSEAERILCHAMTKIQSSVLYFIKDKLKRMKSKHITSYHIKTLCLWVFESMSLPNDLEDIQIKYMEAVINKLFIALQDHRLSHYFIPEHNLLMNLTEDDYEEINEDLKSLIENQYFEHSHNTSGQTYSRGDTTNIEFLFQLVEKSFYQSVHNYFNTFHGISYNH